MTYRKAINTIIDFLDWRKGKANMSFSQQDLDDALTLAIETMNMIDNGKLPCSPAWLRFESMKEEIENFIIQNK